ncbi:helix-turn-helix transcriptional regulator [Halobellus rufus]|uniref:helix-turn-helix transcriptional regulator n=1 Tax=Halobellus rufus TaxID=1448860 RepID=UPI0006789888|nr:MarR family transcriptional regulator [Halobellus rufus]
MEKPHSALEAVNILAERYGMLVELAEQPATQAELGRRTDVSRPTAHRAIRKFEEFGMVRENDGTYELTEIGQAFLTHHKEYLEKVDQLCQLEVVLEQFSDISLNAPILDGAVINYNNSIGGDAAAYDNKEIIENSLRVYSVLDGVSSSYFEVHSGDSPHEEVIRILPDEYADSIIDAYHNPLNELLNSDFFNLYRTSEPVPYTITVAEMPNTSYAILLSHSDGKINLNVRNDNPEAVAWAKERVLEYLETAKRIESV